MLCKKNPRFSIAAGLALSLAGAAAQAEEALVVAHHPSLSATVEIRDLDLRRSEDVARLYHRLNAAADSVCGPHAFDVFYYLQARYHACVEDAVQKAVTRFNIPSLTAYAQQQRAQSDRALLARQ